MTEALDGTVALCRELLDGIPLVLVENAASRFADEVSLRKQQWEETVATNPEWILNLDADEILTSDFGVVQDLLLSGNEDAIYFRLFDMWSETHYREDKFWQAHAYYRPFLIRYHPGMSYEWKETPQHCGRFPLTIQHWSYGCHAPRVKHYGWAGKKTASANMNAIKHWTLKQDTVGRNSTNRYWIKSHDC
ncbi:hypothetical protein Q0F98_10840 [Paenibacillus amylolyticus]|nr:hypothetical protein Q0F98_10840 [Paenibacillus amylolyticus]